MLKNVMRASLLSLIVLSSTHGQEKKAPLPADLAAVPGDALGFAHIRVADIWKSDTLKELRDTVMLAGEKALGGFDQRFVPSPSSIERLTVVVVAADEQLHEEPGVYAILAVSKPYKKDELLKSAMPNAIEKKTTNGNYYVDPKSQTAVAFAPEFVVFGNVKGVAIYVDKKSSGPGPLTEAIQAANSKRHITMAGNFSTIPPELFEKAMKEVPPPFRPLFKAKTATIGFDLVENAKIELIANYESDTAAKTAMAALQDAAKMGRDFLKKGRDEMLATVLGDGKVAPLEKLPEAAMALVALGGMKQLDDFLAAPPLKQEGRQVQISITVPNMSYAGMMPIAVGMLLPAVQKVREAAGRAQSQNNLKQIALAMFNYESAHGQFPPAAICDKNGKPLLSWRVAMLPYIEQQNLYDQFKLDEPWDSEHNKKLLKYKVKVYMSPADPNVEAGLCHYRAFYGKDAILELNQGRKLANVTDGLSNTILVVEADEGVPWTKPDDFEYDPKKPLPKLGGLVPNGFHAAFGDGSVRFIKSSIAEKTLRALITANGGEIAEAP
jgi:hypothetical protein